MLYCKPSWKRCSSKRNATMEPKTKNGANGISLFMPWRLEKASSMRPMMAPAQNAKTAPESIREIPKSQPKPKESLASPNPIHVPFDMSHKMANGNAMTRPERSSSSDGK